MNEHRLLDGGCQTRRFKLDVRGTGKQDLGIGVRAGCRYRLFGSGG